MLLQTMYPSTNNKHKSTTAYIERHSTVYKTAPSFEYQKNLEYGKCSAMKIWKNYNYRTGMNIILLTYVIYLVPLNVFLLLAYPLTVSTFPPKNNGLTNHSSENEISVDKPPTHSVRVRWLVIQLNLLHPCTLCILHT